ncbi:sigma-70 family RNA polymerase sigma factor [Sorangium sp. So ce315]|uniref:RNA polymerase sigma factor n=1 Tax=Sorangium sp. So ce315 TaxID=3133299 RepID=UPI003F637D44
MKPRRKGAKSQPTARHPRKKPSIEAIMAERSAIMAVIVASGVPARDRADVFQNVVMGAWRSIKRGLYRPAPRDDPRKALRGYLYSVARHLSMHYVNSAWARRFILDPQPLGRLRGVVGPNLDAQIEARDLLRAIERLEPRHREILLAVDTPETLSAYAAQRGMNPFTAASRLRIARAMLALRIQRWRR